MESSPMLEFIELGNKMKVFLLSKLFFLKSKASFYKIFWKVIVWIWKIWYMVIKWEKLPIFG